MDPLSVLVSIGNLVKKIVDKRNEAKQLNGHLSSLVERVCLLERHIDHLQDDIKQDIQSALALHALEKVLIEVDLFIHRFNNQNSWVSFFKSNSNMASYHSLNQALTTTVSDLHIMTDSKFQTIFLDELQSNGEQLQVLLSEVRGLRSDMASSSSSSSSSSVTSPSSSSSSSSASFHDVAQPLSPRPDEKTLLQELSGIKAMIDSLQQGDSKMGYAQPTRVPTRDEREYEAAMRNVYEAKVLHSLPLFEAIIARGGPLVPKIYYRLATLWIEQLVRAKTEQTKQKGIQYLKQAMAGNHELARLYHQVVLEQKYDVPLRRLLELVESESDTEALRDIFYLVGLIYSKPHFAGHDMKKAIKYWTTAAESKHATAAGMLGYYLARSDNPHDRKLGCQYSEQSAKLGNPTACCNIGLQLLAGKNIQKDIEQAAHYFLVGAQMHAVDCQGEISKLYEKGTKTIPKNYEMAKYWKQEAIKNGFQPRSDDCCCIIC